MVSLTWDILTLSVFLFSPLFGQIRFEGKIGLVPDNFVEAIPVPPSGKAISSLGEEARMMEAFSCL